MAELEDSKSSTNLNNIKSSDILKKVFLYLNENQKLNIIIYNKKLQKRLSVKLGDYINLSGKYKIVDKNGKGKEYSIDSNILLFEGEYFNGKRKGIGKEYDHNGKLQFEGEYLNGKRNGKGKEYHYIFYDFVTSSGKNNDSYEEMFFNGEKNEEREKENYYLYDVVKIFEGEYLNGKRNGKGKEYSDKYREYGKLIFEGEYLNDKRNGKGKEYEYNYREECYKIIYEGEYLNGERNGKGKEYDSTYDKKYLLKFEGEYLNGKIWDGKGYNKEGNLEFEIKNGKGFIKEYINWNKIFEGEYLNGIRNGKGKEFYHNDDLKFEGEYLNGKIWNGKGYNNKDGELEFEIKNGKGYIKEYDEYGKLEFEGEYLNGERNGKGKEFVDYEGSRKKNRLVRFKGEYLNGKRNGKGKEYYNGELEFEGEYLNGKRNGKGKEYFYHSYEPNLKFEGEYLNGERNGKGKEYYDIEDDNKQNKIMFEGEYLKGKIWNGKGYNKDGG